jgi:hypothetical protein
MKTLSIMAALAVWLLLGCSGIALDRKVEDNTFVSPSYPEVRIRVSPSLGYIGKTGTARHHQSINGTSGLLVNYSSHLFLERDRDNTIRRGVIIRVDRMSKGSWETDLFSGVKNRIASDYQEMNGCRYEHFLAVRSDIFTDCETDFITGRGGAAAKPVTLDGKMTFSGYVIPKCCMMEAFGMIAGANRDTRICVFYFEDLARMSGCPSCNDWMRGDIRPGDQERIKAAFMRSRASALTFVEKLR